MIFSIFPQHIILIAVGFINLFIAIYVLSKEPKNIVNQTFFVSVLGVAFWGLGIALLAMTGSFIFDKMILYGGTIMIVGFVFFTKVFPFGKPLNKIFLLNLIPLIVILIAIPFNVFIKEVTISSGGFPEPVNGPAFPFLAITLVVYILYSLFQLIKNYLKATGLKQLQMKYLFTGIGILISATAIFDLILPAFNIFNFNIFGPTTSVVFVAFTAYAIVRHQLMDIRVVIQRGLIYSVLVVIILLFYVAFLNALGFVFQQQTEVTAFFSAALATLIAVFTIPIIDRYLRKVTDKVFFKDKYNYSEAIHDLSEILNKTIQLEILLCNIVHVLQKIFRTKKALIFMTHRNLLCDENGVLQTIATPYSDGFIKERLKHPEAIINSHISHILTQPNLDQKWKGALQEIQGIGNKYEIEVTLPIVLDDRIIGFLALGKKLSGDSYTREDITLLKTFCYQAAIALEKARLYEEVAGYSRVLEKKVKERTREIEKLQQAQKQMMIDISHGLQTPLTTIKSELGFLKKQIPPNKKVSVFEKSIDEVSLFIYDLLTLARLDAGEEKFKKEPMSLSKMLCNQVEYFEVIVEEHHIALDSSIEDGITILGDKKKLEELVVNLVSNAIKYMKQKGKREIHIGLKSARDITTLTIADSGIGISAQDLPYIFERFHRLKNLSNADITGTGLGLAICKKIVEQHEGTITATSSIGKGTTFTVTLPITLKSDIQQTK